MIPVYPFYLLVKLDPIFTDVSDMITRVVGVSNLHGYSDHEEYTFDFSYREVSYTVCGNSLEDEVEVFSDTDQESFLEISEFVKKFKSILPDELLKKISVSTPENSSLEKMMNDPWYKKFVRTHRGLVHAKRLNLLESQETLDSEGMTYLKQVQSIVTGKQKEYYDWQVIHALKVNISKMPENVYKCDPKLHKCYENSFFVAYSNENLDVKYVEGIMMLHGFPIDHAWNRIGDTYFDVTAEGPLSGHNSPDSGHPVEYIALLELNAEQLLKWGTKTGMSGPFLPDIFRAGEQDHYLSSASPDLI